MRYTVLLIFFISFVISNVSHAEIQKLDPLDLNGDGINEIPQLEIHEGSYELKIGDVEVNHKMDKAFGVKDVDLDKASKTKALIVFGEGPGGGVHQDLFIYDMPMIKHVGRFDGDLKFTGYGIAYVSSQQGFWRKKERYRYDKTTKSLRHTPQSLYYVGQTATVKKSFALLLNKNDPNSKVTLKLGSSIEILAADMSQKTCTAPNGKQSNYGCEWYLVKSSSGLLGWVDYYTLADHAGGLVFPG